MYQFVWILSVQYTLMSQEEFSVIVELSYVVCFIIIWKLLPDTFRKHLPFFCLLFFTMDRCPLCPTSRQSNYKDKRIIPCPVKWCLNTQNSIYGFNCFIKFEQLLFSPLNPASYRRRYKNGTSSSLVWYSTLKRQILALAQELR